MSVLSIKLGRFVNLVKEDGSDLSEFIDIEDPERGAPSLPSFYVLAGAVLETQHKYLDSRATDFEYMESYPEDDENVQAPRITYCLAERRYAATSKNRIGSPMSDGAIRPYTPIIRGTTKLDSNASRILTHSAVDFENIIEFKVAARTNKVATWVALWVERTIRRFQSVFEDAGYKVYFLKQLKDGVDSTGNRKVPTRTLQYLVRTQDTSTTLDSIISCIDLKIGVTNG